MNCAKCGLDLEVRPVWLSVAHPTKKGVKVQKRVRCKPRQVVLLLRQEGSLDTVTGETVPDSALKSAEWRVCLRCMRGLTGAQAVSVLMDAVMASGGK